MKVDMEFFDQGRCKPRFDEPPELVNGMCRNDRNVGCQEFQARLLRIVPVDRGRDAVRVTKDAVVGLKLGEILDGCLEAAPTSGYGPTPIRGRKYEGCHVETR